MTVSVRRFAEKDLEQVLNLCAEIREYHRKILNGYFTAIDRDFEKNVLLSGLNDDNSLVFVAADDFKIVGLLIAEKKNAPYLEKSSVCDVGTLGVTEKYRHCGIGKLLMNELIKFCRENQIQEIKLSVFNRNINACKFYEHYGFIPQEQKMSLKLD